MITIVDDVAAVHDRAAAVAPEWDRLVDACDAPLFARPGWLQAWLDAFGGADRLTIHTIRRDGELVALVPLLRGRLPGVLSSPTNIDSPTWGPLAVDGAAAQALARSVLAGGPSRLRVDVVALDDPASRHFVETLERAGYRRSVRLREHPPFVDATLHPEVVLKRLSARRRSNLRRAARRLGDLGDLRFEVHRSADGLDAVLDEVLHIEASGWKGERGTAVSADPRREGFYRAVTRWAAERGWLLLTALRLDRRMIAFSLAFDHHDVVHGLKLAYDEDFGKHSPGVQMLHRTLTLALEGTARTFDLLGDDDPYKAAVADGTIERVNADWCAPTGYGRGLFAASTTRLALEGAVRDRLSDGAMDTLRTLKRRTTAQVR